MSLNSVRTKLILWNFCVLALVLIALGTILRVTAEINLESGINRTQKAFAQNIAKTCQDSGLLKSMVSAKTSTAHTSALFALDRFHSYPPRILDITGRPLLLPTYAGETSSVDSLKPWDSDAVDKAVNGDDTFTTVSDHGTPLRIYTMPLMLGDRTVGVIQVAKSLTEVYDELSNVDQRLIELLPLALLFAGICGAFLTTSALRPVRQIAHAASQIEAASLSGRLPVTGGDEFAELATTINGMLSRLEGAFQKLELAYEQQRRFAADASHELRTPLTVIKANTSLALSEHTANDEVYAAMSAIDRAADRTSRIVQDLLLLARSDAGELSVALVPTDIDTVLNQAVDMTQIPNSAPIVLKEEGELGNGTLKALGDRDSLVRLFMNLFTNAMRHTPESGTVAVTVKREGNSVKVIVSDNGEGIPPQHIPHITERFYRVDKARSRKMGGTGLGLAICKSIVESHHGLLDIESAVGKGTTVSVTLPSA